MNFKRSTTIALTVAVAFFMQNLDTTAVNTAIPKMAESFNTDIIHLSAGITSYMIALAIFIPVSGWIADRFGTRKVFCTAIVLFIISSILCGISQSLMQFVLCRILQGMAGAMMTPVGRLAVLKATPKNELVKVMNYITLPALVAPILGPLVGGYLATYFRWHWIFFLNVPISIICIILALKHMPKDDEDKVTIKKHFDSVGFVLSGLGLSGFMFGMELFSQNGIAYWLPASIVITGLILIYLNFKYSKCTSSPLIDYSVLTIPTYRITIFTGTISRMIIGVAPYLIPLMFQIGFGMSPFESGLLFVATMVGNLSMKTITVYVIRRFPFRNILIINGALIGLFTFLTSLLLPTTPVYLIVLLMFVSGMVRSMQFTSITTLAFSEIPESHMTAANSLYSTIQQMSAGMGIAIGAVILRFSNIINEGQKGIYKVADFRLAFIVIAILALIHLYGYTKLAPDAGDAVRNKKVS